MLQGEVGKPQGIIDRNLAAEKDLSALPGMNPALVKGIMDRRPFLSQTDFNAFLSQSLKPEQLTPLYEKTFIHINLNPAPDAEISAVGQENFGWIVNAVADMAVNMALSGESPIKDLKWSALLAGPSKGAPGVGPA